MDNFAGGFFHLKGQYFNGNLHKSNSTMAGQLQKSLGQKVLNPGVANFCLF